MSQESLYITTGGGWRGTVTSSDGECGPVSCLAVSHGCATWVHRGCLSYEDDVQPLVAPRYAVAASPVAVEGGCASGTSNDSPSLSLCSVEVVIVTAVNSKQRLHVWCTCLYFATVLHRKIPSKAQSQSKTD